MTAFLLVVFVFTVSLLLIFCKLLTRSLYTELLFIFLVLFSAYTVIPTVMFWTDYYPMYSPLGGLYMTDSEVAAQIIRHIWFIVAVGGAYIAVRGSKPISLSDKVYVHGQLKRINLLFLGGTLVITYAIILLLSAPVESYYDHYTRFRHLPDVIQKFISVMLRASQGISFLFLVGLVARENPNTKTFVLASIGIAAFEIIYSQGARINAIYIIIFSFFIFCRFVKTPRLSSIIFGALLLSSLLSIIELVRLKDSSDVAEIITKATSFAGEFESVFYSSVFLYRLKALDSIPPVSFFTIIYDFIALIPFVDYFEFHPMSWFWINFNFYGEVPNTTLGPIANSAYMGGLVAILLQGMLVGAVYGGLSRWYAKKGGVSSSFLYGYVYATVIMMPKWTPLVQMQGLLKTVLPILIVWYFFRRVPSYFSALSSPVEKK